MSNQQNESQKTNKPALLTEDLPAGHISHREFQHEGNNTDAKNLLTEEEKKAKKEDENDDD